MAEKTNPNKRKILTIYQNAREVPKLSSVIYINDIMADNNYEEQVEQLVAEYIIREKLTC